MMIQEVESLLAAAAVPGYTVVSTDDLRLMLNNVPRNHWNPNYTTAYDRLRAEVEE